jgi:hypothetical protein
LEVVTPSVLTWIEETHWLPGLGIDAKKVRALVEIAAIAGPSEIFHFGGPAVLPGDHVIAVIRPNGILLREAAVFAASTGALADQLAEALVHEQS